MPALVGTCWASDAWADDAWATDTWAAAEDAEVVVASQSRTALGFGIGIPWSVILFLLR